MVSDEKVKAIASGEAATEQARHGDVSGAKERAELIPLQFWGSRAFCGIGEAQTNNRDLIGAKQSLLEAQAIGEKIGDESSKGIALGRVAVARGKTRDFARARATAESVKDTGWGKPALGDVVSEQAKSGDFSGANAVLLAMDGFTEIPRREIIASQARAGLFTSAERLVEAITDPSIRWNSMLTLAEAANELGGGRKVSSIREMDD